MIETHNLQRLDQEEIEAWDRSIANRETESITKNPPIKAVDGFTGEFYQTFKDELILIFSKLFQEAEEENSSELVKPDTKARQKDTTRKENYTTISLIK